MNEQPLVKSTFPLGTSIFLILGGIGMCAIATYLGVPALQEEYPQLPGLILGGFFGLMGIACIIAALTIPKFEVYKDRLEVKSILGGTRKTIYRNEIISWTELAKETKYQNWIELTIFTQQGKYKISSSTCGNFDGIKNELTKGKHNDYVSEARSVKQFYKYYALATFLFGCLCFWGSYHFYATKDSKLTFDQLTSITSIITTKPEISKSAKGHRSIQFELKDYPNFEFQLSGVNYSATFVDDFVSNVNLNDTVSLDITTDEYKKKLSKEKELSYLDKSVNYRFIYIYGLRANQNTYLSLSDYNIENNSDRGLGIWFCGLLGIFFTVMAIYQLKLNK
jgi:hypothetical protein